MAEKILIVGAGIFGVTASISLRRRGYEVHLFEKGKIPNPNASTTDISKMIRADYGADTFYMDMMLEAFKGWEKWNKEWPQPLYHPVGFLLMTYEKVKEGSLEYESRQAFEERGIPVQPVTPELLAEQFPAWEHAPFKDGYYNPLGGWAESGAVLTQLAATAKEEGVIIHEDTPVMSFMANGDSVGGIFTEDGQVIGADRIIVSAGAWSAHLVKELKDKIQVTGQPVYHFKPKFDLPYKEHHFPGWSADISTTGWYGFPVQKDGLVKVAHHGAGTIMDPNEKNDIPPHFYPSLNTFLSRNLPQLEHAPVDSARICYYCDSWDSDFYICRHPQLSNLTIACGGSGHGFKFAPIIGDLIADVTEGKPNPYAHRFAWRERGEGGRSEAARMKE
jgi:glycine/D-amino acid oxidase-like deaminating enzyme